MGRVHLAALKASDEISLAGIVEPADAVRARGPSAEPGSSS